MTREGAAAPLSTATWRTKEGSLSLLSDLSNHHLYCCIRLMERRAVKFPVTRQTRLAMLYRERDRRERKGIKGARARFYVQRSDNSVVKATLDEWAEWFEKCGERRRVAFTTVTLDAPKPLLDLDETSAFGALVVATPQLPYEVNVSTILVGIDMDYSGDLMATGPLLYETQVFGGVCDQQRLRHRSREEARVAHEQMVNTVRGAEWEEKKRATKVQTPVGPVSPPPLVELAPTRKIRLE